MYKMYPSLGGLYGEMWTLGTFLSRTTHSSQNDRRFEIALQKFTHRLSNIRGKFLLGQSYRNFPCFAQKISVGLRRFASCNGPVPLVSLNQSFCSGIGHALGYGAGTAGRITNESRVTNPSLRRLMPMTRSR